MVTVNPTLPAHCLCWASLSLCGGGGAVTVVLSALLNVSMALISSKFHVLPMLKLPLVFSLALCIRTRPVLRTAMMMSRGFLLLSTLSGGGGADG